MAENSKIEWTDHTWSPWEGCQKTGSLACQNCYAETRNARFGGGVAPNWGPHAPRRLTAEAGWRKPLAWDRIAGERGARESVFPSLCDPFDNKAPEGARARFANLILGTPNLDWLLLTKRIGNVLDMLIEMFPDGVPPNVRIGATVVTHEEWLRDFPKMKQVFVACGRPLFLSVEPMMGRIDLDAFGPAWRRVIGWVIVGGESGAGARPMHPDWARSLRDQCAAAGVPFLFKQWGEWAPLAENGNGFWPADEGGFIRLTGDGQRNQWGWPMQRVGKKAAGRLLDGVEHNGVPA